MPRNTYRNPYVLRLRIVTYASFILGLLFGAGVMYLAYFW